MLANYFSHKSFGKVSGLGKVYLSIFLISISHNLQGMVLTLEQRIFIVDCYAETKSCGKCAEMFAEEFHIGTALMRPINTGGNEESSG